MLDFSISSGQLMLIWSFAGAICCLPFFTKNIWQRFFTVPIIFIAIWLSFYTNHEFIGRPMYERPPEQFVYEHHAVIYDKGERLIVLWAVKDGINKLFKFPHTEQNEEALDQAKRNADRSGVPQMGENLDDEKKGIISSVLKKEKITTVSTTLNFFDMPNQLLPEK